MPKHKRRAVSFCGGVVDIQKPYNHLLSVKGRYVNIARVVQVALLSEVPPTLRFLYASLNGNKLHYHAVFTSDATDGDLECASVVLTEVIAACPANIELDEKIERNSDLPWKIGNGENLLYLRHGELSDT
jgi:hypothetical protein